MSAATAHLARREPHICRDGDDHEDDRHEDEARRRARAAGARRHAHAHHCERNADTRMRASPSPTALAPRVRSCRVGAVPALLRLCRGPRAGLAACGRAVWRAPPPPCAPPLSTHPPSEAQRTKISCGAERARQIPPPDQIAGARYGKIVTRQPVRSPAPRILLNFCARPFRTAVQKIANQLSQPVGAGARAARAARKKKACAYSDESVELGLCGDGGCPRGRGALGAERPTGLTVSFMQAGAATGLVV